MAEWIASIAASLVPMLGRALLAFLWQGALIGVLAAVALQLLRDARAQVRYAVACLALLACVLLPLSGIALQWLALAQATLPTPLAPLRSDVVIGMSTASAAAWPRGFEEFFPLVVSLWAAGASVLSLRMALGLAWIQRLRTTPQGPGQPAWQARLDAVSQKFGSMRRVALRLVDGLDSPVSTGCWRPVVLLPAALAARMPVELVEALLAHELAHVRRHDYLVNLLQCVVEALLFYHPVTWWLSRRIRIEREQIADALAADAIGSPRRLAVALSELSHCRRAPATSSRFAPAAHGGQLMSRIQQLIMSDHRRPERRVAGGKIALPLIGLAAAGIALYANAGQVPRPAPVAAATASVHATSAPVAIARPTVSSGPVLAMAAAAPAATPKTESRTIRLHDDDGDSYALVRKGERGITMSGSSDDIAAIEAARARADRDFIWFSRKGVAYVIDDPATVSRANDAWRDTDALGKQMETLGARMQVHGDRMQGLGTQMQTLTAGYQETPEMRSSVAAITALASKQQALAMQQASLGAEMATADDARREDLERRMDALGEQMDALSSQMDEHQATLDAATETLEANQAPIEALGRQMEEAGKPMDALGKQMDELGERQEANAKRAEAALQALISDAMQRGLAKPASAM